MPVEHPVEYEAMYHLNPQKLQHTAEGAPYIKGLTVSTTKQPQHSSVHNHLMIRNYR